MLKATGVNKSFPGGVQALSNIDLDVDQGETIALIGESGSGKTTLLRCFNRTIEPDSGRLEIDGRSILEQDPVHLRRHLGYVPQDGGLMPHWPVARNVALVPTFQGWDDDRKAVRTKEVLTLVGLSPQTFSSRYPHALSGGQRQRVAIARALAADPQVVLLDEPFGALDAITRHELQSEFQSLQRGLAKTTVLVTHDLSEAFRLADRIAVMRAGRLLQVGAPSQLASTPADPYITQLLHRGGVGE